MKLKQEMEVNNHDYILFYDSLSVFIITYVTVRPAQIPASDNSVG